MTIRVHLCLYKNVRYAHKKMKLYDGSCNWGKFFILPLIHPLTQPNRNYLPNFFWLQFTKLNKLIYFNLILLVFK